MMNLALIQKVHGIPWTQIHQHLTTQPDKYKLILALTFHQLKITHTSILTQCPNDNFPQG